MSNAIPPSNHQIIKNLLVEIDRAEAAKRVILQAQQSLRSNDDALLKLGFTAEHVAEFNHQKTAGRAYANFFDTRSLDTAISYLRAELAKVVRESIQSKVAANAEIQLDAVAVDEPTRQSDDQKPQLESSSSEVSWFGQLIGVAN